MRKPKRPKVTSSLRTWENYYERLKNYESWKKQKISDKNKKEALIDKATKLASSL